MLREILNPPVAGAASRRGASHKASTDTPPTQDGLHATAPHGHGTPVPRRILTPRSLAARVERGGQHPGINVQRSSFLPPMPTAPDRSQAYYGYLSMPIMRPATLSQTGSPIVSTPSANPTASQTYLGPFPFPGGPPPPSSTPYYPGSTFAPQVVPQGGAALQYQAPASSTQDPYSRAPSVSASSKVSSVGSARQTSASDPIQVLTTNTSQGSYRVPVEVHQASRLADEKRARNAGASARFRQRRKEKEREATTTIEKIQHQTRELERRVREVEQERDFYRSERDRMRDVLARTPETRHLIMQGPPSPQTLRTGSYHDPTPLSQPSQPPAATAFTPQDTSLSERAPRRRQTGPSGVFTNTAYPLPPASTLPPVQSGYFSQGAPSTANGGHIYTNHGGYQYTPSNDDRSASTLRPLSAGRVRVPRAK